MHPAQAGSGLKQGFGQEAEDNLDTIGHGNGITDPRGHLDRRAGRRGPNLCQVALRHFGQGQPEQNEDR